MQTDDPFFPLQTYTTAIPSASASWAAGVRLTRQADGGLAPAPIGIAGEFFAAYPSTPGGPVGITRTAASRRLLTTGAVALGDSIYAAANGLVANTQANGAVFVGTAQGATTGAGLVSVA